MKKNMLFCLILSSFFFSCIKDEDKVDFQKVDPGISFYSGDSLINRHFQTYSTGLVNYINFKVIPDDIIIGFNADFSDFHIELRERYIIDDLSNSTANVNRQSIECGYLNSYKPSKNEFEKIFKLGSKNIVNSDHFLSRDKGLIISYQNENGYYLSSNEPFIKNDSLIEPFFIIDEFRNIKPENVENSIEVSNENLYYVKARFSMKMYNTSHSDSIMITNANAVFIVYN